VADSTKVPTGTLDILRFGICIAAGCGSETTINYIATMGAGSFTECAFNLATAATGSSVIVDVQDGSGTSIFGATKLVATAANGTAVEYQSTFANSPQTYARGSKYKAVILQNDSGGAAQGGTVQCR
jgi:alkaline phosphatase